MTVKLNFLFDFNNFEWQNSLKTKRDWARELEGGTTTETVIAIAS